MENEAIQETEVKVLLKGKGRISPTHFNSNLLCAVDVETTGLNPTKHEIIQMAVIPLKADYTTSQEFKWFDLLIRPENVDDEMRGWKRNKLTQALLHGMDRWAAVDYFREWFLSLKLAPRKLITPLGHNYQHDHRFLIEFFGGPESYSEFFKDDYRDTQKLALGWNDIAELRTDTIPYPKNTLNYLCACLNVENLRQHDAVYDAVTTAEVYRRLLNYNYWYKRPTLPQSFVLLATDFSSIKLILEEQTDKIYIPAQLSGSIDLDKKKIELADGVLVVQSNDRVQSLIDYAVYLNKKVYYYENH